MVAISFPRFLLGNQRLGLEPDNQKELIGGVFKSWVLNLGVERFFEGEFLRSPFFEPFK
jgi:hypothetical protein